MTLNPAKHGILSIVLFVTAIGYPWAAVAEQLAYRGVTHNVAASAQPVGDADGHVVGVAKFSGLAFLEDGSVGTTHYVVTFDYRNGSGPWHAYHALILEDGSSLWFDVRGQAVAEGAHTALSVERLTVIGGTGRFESASGDGRTGPSGLRYAPWPTGETRSTMLC